MYIPLTLMKFLKSLKRKIVECHYNYYDVLISVIVLRCMILVQQYYYIMSFVVMFILLCQVRPNTILNFNISGGNVAGGGEFQGPPLYETLVNAQ